MMVMPLQTDENNYSLIFDGLDDMVQIPNNSAYDFVNEFTLEYSILNLQQTLMVDGWQLKVSMARVKMIVFGVFMHIMIEMIIMLNL